MYNLFYSKQIVFGETGTKIEGKDIIYTEPRFAIAIDKVKDGTAPVAKFKTKNGYGEGSSANTSASGFINIPDGVESEIPF